MYKLRTNKSDTYQLETAYNGSYLGSLKQVLSFAVISHGFSIMELESAILEMNEKDHDIAHFGVRKTLIYTEKEVK